MILDCLENRVTINGENWNVFLEKIKAEDEKLEELLSQLKKRRIERNVRDVTNK